MANENNPMLRRNKMTAEQLKASQNGAKIDIIPSATPGKAFFVCGSVQGYVSPAVLEGLEAGTLTVDSIDYLECKPQDSPDLRDATQPADAVLADGRSNSNWVPCLVSKAKNVLYRL